jgi:CRISPR/Cas system CSM-associated protein Csm3 (group 7 of RAMP superfamily)
MSGTIRDLAARNPVRRWVFFRGWLVVQTPFLIGDVSDSDVEGESRDIPILRESDNPESAPYVPGTSIAGALWQLCRDAAKAKCVECAEESLLKLFGLAPKESDDGTPSEPSWQSPLITYDCFAEESPKSSIRDGVALQDGVRLASKETNAKYDYEVCEAGSRFVFQLELRIRVKTTPDEEKKLENLLERILATLCGRGVRLGRKTSRGLGLFKLEEMKRLVIDVNDDNGERAYSDYVDFGWESSPFTTWPDTDSNEEAIEELPTIWKSARFDVSFPHTLLIRDYRSMNTDADFMMTTETYPDSTSVRKTVPVIYGTAWDGLLRSASRRVLIDLDCCEEVVKGMLVDAFGSDHKDMANKNQKKPPVASKIIIKDSRFNGRAEHLPLTRTAIDRFSQEVVKTKLFSEEVLAPAATSLHIECCDDWAYELICLALLDVNDGFAPLGGEVSVGRGICKVDKGLALVTDQDNVVVGCEHLLEEIKKREEGKDE